ncbi:MAG: GyrI-like domain-containing protein [Rickettsiales bacterium]|jgi:predicted transcriptional regulator YdeE|nr:GyrI-like domain-containing protein [Rickettsiales bacterium]
MQETKITLPEIKLVGIKKIRTINEAEFDPKTAQILPTIQKYFQENYPNKIKHRKNPGRTFAIYFEYENDYKGKYSYFIGEEVTEFTDNNNLEQYTIPDQTYNRFTTESGEMANVIVKAWQEIWQMDDSNRNYIADFEIYDQRAQDPKNAIVDIYIGVKN